MAALEFSKEFPAILPWEVQQKVPLVWLRRWHLAKKAEHARYLYDRWKKDPTLVSRDKQSKQLMLWTSDKDE